MFSLETPTMSAETTMSVATIFQIQLILGYVPWLLSLSAYVWPRFKI